MRIITRQSIDGFLDYLAKEERSGATIEKYKRDISALCDFLLGREVTKELVIEYKKQLLCGGYSERSINSMLAAVNSFFSFMNWYDCRVKALKISPEIYIPEERELTEQEYFRLVNAARKNGRETLSLIIQTLCCTGIRISELRFITVEALKKGEALVRCKGKTRKVFLIDGLRKVLKLYAKKHRLTSGALFVGRNGEVISRTTVWRAMKRLCEDAGVNPTKVFPHNLRHLFARAFYKKEKDIARLADILGHNSINTTRIYIASSGRDHQRSLERLGLLCRSRC